MSVDVGPAEVAVDSEPSPHCTLGLDRETCIATWDEGQDRHNLSDDQITVTRFANRLRVSVEVPGEIPREEIAIDSSDATVAHPLNHVVKDTWLDLNDSRPEMTKG